MKKSLVGATLLILVGAVPTTLIGLSGAQIVAISAKAAVAQDAVTRTVIANLLGSGIHSKTTSTKIGGIQFATVRGHQIDVVYVNSVAYVKMDAYSIKAVFGLTNAKIDNKWISFTSGHNYFAQFSVGLTLPSLVGVLTPGGTLGVSASRP